MFYKKGGRYCAATCIYMYRWTCIHPVYICTHIHCVCVRVCLSVCAWQTWNCHYIHVETCVWFIIKLHVIFCKRATNYRALWRKMTYRYKPSYASLPPWMIYMYAVRILYTPICMYICLYLPFYLHTCVCIYVCIDMCVNRYIHTFMYVYGQISSYSCVYMLFVFIYQYTCIYVRVYIDIIIYIYWCIYRYM